MPNEQTATPPEQAPAPESKASKPDESFKIVHLDSSKELHRVKVPKDSNDVNWDARLELGADEFEGMIASMSGKARPRLVTVWEEGDEFHPIDGKTMLRAIPEANKRRKKAGLPPFPLILAVVPKPDFESEEGLAEIRRAMFDLNTRMESPPSVLAQEIKDGITCGVPESYYCERLKCSLPALIKKVRILDLPKNVQKMVDDGLISEPAALKLIDLPDDKVEATARALAAAAAAGQKVSSAAVKKRTTGPKPMTGTQKKQLILNAQSNTYAGKYGEAVKWTIIACMEAVLGTRDPETLEDCFDKIAKGHGLKVDFKQYQND